MKNSSNGAVKVAWILDADMLNPEFPSAAVLNAALDLSPAIAWQDYEVGPSDSADIDDRSLISLGNEISRGAASYGATLSMFRDKDNKDATSTYVKAFEKFRVERSIGWLVTRVNSANNTVFANGDEISVYKLIADTTADATEGDSSTKFTVQFLPQAVLHFHTQVGTTGTMTGVTATKSATVGTPYQLAPIAGGASIMSRATYKSSAPLIAAVSVGGTVSPLTVGSATITVSYGATSANITQAVTVSA